MAVGSLDPEQAGEQERIAAGGVGLTGKPLTAPLLPLIPG
jgi:hypothetical protein